MSATYDELLSTDKDRARAMLGATNVASAATALLSDEHINAALTDRGSLSAGVAFLADALAVRYAQQPGQVTLPSGLSVSWRERVSAWQALAARLRAEVAAAAPLPVEVTTPIGSFAVAIQSTW